MNEYEIHPLLDKKLNKISKKDPQQFKKILTKIEEIINNKNINHYKNLKKPLQKYKRVHIHSSFVLLFRVEKNKIIFTDYEHHDNVYK